MFTLVGDIEANESRHQDSTVKLLSTKEKGCLGSPLNRWVSETTSKPFVPLTLRCVYDASQSEL